MNNIIDFKPAVKYDEMLYECNCGSRTFSIGIYEDSIVPYIKCTSCNEDMNDFELTYSLD